MSVQARANREKEGVVFAPRKEGDLEPRSEEVDQRLRSSRRRQEGPCG